MQSDMYYDAVIAGCGVAGLYTALNLPETMRILMICKGDMAECDSMLAQGGICFGWVSALNKMRMEVCDIPVREDIPVQGYASIRI